MKTLKYLTYFFFGILLFSSCSPQLSPFTERLQDEFDWSENELQQIQFYTSKDIVLQRDFSSGESTITGGKIRVINGREVEEVVIRRGTPGVLMFTPKENRFAVSFEEGDEKYLMFGPNPKAGGKFVLLAKDWRRNTGKVSYDGRIYNTPSSSAYANLMVDLKKLRKLSVKSRKAKGRTVGR
ncbi:MAG: hypothetical protein AAGK97_15355 [Bacteroidota bacterium]